MQTKPQLMAAGLLIAGLGLTACNGSGNTASPAVTVTDTVTAPAGASTTPATTTPASTDTESMSSGSTTSPGTAGTSSQSSSTGGTDLPLTPAVREELIDAGAKAHGLPASDYVGLVAGSAFYAIDNTTKIYWAAASMDPSPSSQQAQIGSQDDGAYTIFELTPGGSWNGVNVGEADSNCALQPPAAVVQAWGWTAGSCHPPNF